MSKQLFLTFHPVTEADIYQLAGWRYEAPYDFYNLGALTQADVAYFLDPGHAYYSLFDDQKQLVAFCCFGWDARVPGGDYRTNALDIGLGIRPDLTGCGLGGQFIQAVCEFAQLTFNPPALRVTVAVFNQRALRVWSRAGFQEVQRFQRSRDGEIFSVLIR